MQKNKRHQGLSWFGVQIAYSTLSSEDKLDSLITEFVTSTNTTITTSKTTPNHTAKKAPNQIENPSSFLTQTRESQVRRLLCETERINTCTEQSQGLDDQNSDRECSRKEKNSERLRRFRERESSVERESKSMCVSVN